MKYTIVLALLMAVAIGCFSRGVIKTEQEAINLVLERLETRWKCDPDNVYRKYPLRYSAEYFPARAWGHGTTENGGWRVRLASGPDKNALIYGSWDVWSDGGRIVPRIFHLNPIKPSETHIRKLAFCHGTDESIYTKPK